MNVRIIQPPYPQRPEDTEATVSFMIRELEQCDPSLDLILLPECCNAPASCGDRKQLKELADRYGERLLNMVKATALRCNVTIGINLYCENDEGKLQNTTLLYNCKGEVVAKYVKQHLPASEFGNPLIDHSYLYETTAPTCVEVDGIRYAFLTCYDTYYTEFICRMAAERPDIVLISSLQRAERQDILEMQAKMCAFLCNAYVVRSSYGMGTRAQTGGCSMIVSPEGIILQNFQQFVGSFDCMIDDVHYKYMRSNGFGQPAVENDVYQTSYRSPWSYRVGGSGVVPTDKEVSFPRLCAHRGFISAAPENTIPSVAIAVSLGAIETEIDVRPTSDGVLVISHDPHVNRLTDATGIIQEMTYQELRALEPGKKFSASYEGVGYATLEEMFKTFPRRTIFNLHVKPLENVSDYRPMIREIVEMAKKYDCADHFYFASEGPEILKAALEVAPEIERCALTPETGTVTTEMILGTALQYKCTRLQALREYMTDELIAKAHQAGIRCNLFYADDPVDARQWLDKGVDTILTDNYLSVHLGTGLR